MAVSFLILKLCQRIFGLDRSYLVNQFPLDVLDPQRTSNLKPILWKCPQTSISQAFALEDRVDMRVEKPLTSRGLVPILVKPLRDLPIPHSFVMESLDQIMQFRLIVGIWCRIGESRGR